MSNKEIYRTMTDLRLMLADLNDVHNNYDIETVAETRYKQDLDEAISDFNSSQDTWTVRLEPTKKGWKLIYE